jgi:hypothetical protein
LPYLEKSVKLHYFYRNKRSLSYGKKAAVPNE